MGLFEFFFPDIATASHLRAMREQNEHAARMRRSHAPSTNATMVNALKLRIDDLEKDLGFLTLLSTALLSALNEKGAITREDVLKELEELDTVDGDADGQLDIHVLRTYLGQRRGQQPSA